MHIADVSKGMLGANGVVGAGMPLACGAALTAQVTGSGTVTVCFFGDGAANIGSFHEALNLASIWKLPVVFVCENNRYAESTPVEYAMAADHVAARAAAYGMPGMVADGQDVLDVYEKAREAVRRARDGGGPTLVECLTYRYYGHHLGDPDAQYRTREEVGAYRQRDCIQRLHRWLVEHGTCSEDELSEVQREAETLLDKAVAFAEASPDPDPASDLSRDVYARYS